MRYYRFLMDKVRCSLNLVPQEPPLFSKLLEEGMAMSAQAARIACQNIEHYVRLLQTARDEQKRETLRKLEVEAEVRLTRIGTQSGGTPPQAGEST